MGQAASAGLAQLVEQYGLNVFVESGTGWGQSVRDALQVAALERIYSIEIDEEPYRRNKADFVHQGRVRILHGDSRQVAPALVRSGKIHDGDRVFWYLDAHFPGSGRANPREMLPLWLPAKDAVPLLAEVFNLARVRDFQHDVIVIDDRCLWEADAYTGEGGDQPAFRDALRSDDLQRVEEVLSASHDVQKTCVDMGYAIFTPKARS